MDDGITVISQTTAERQQETKELFEKIKPLLDKGMIYSAAIRKVKGLPSDANRYQSSWYKEVIAYGETQGYPYEKYSGKKNNRRGLEDDN